MMLYPSYVFKYGEDNKLARMATGCVYIVGFFLGMCLTILFSNFLDADRIAIFFTIGVTMLFNFCAMRLILRSKFLRSAHLQ